MAGSWRSLARGLRLSPSIISLIASQCLNDPKDCLFLTLEDWLKKMYNTERYGNPSWSMLVKAMASPAGGANPALALSIAQNYPGISQKMIMVC